MPASSGAQPAAKFSSPPAPSQGIIDDRQELRRCEYVALGPGPGRGCQWRHAFRIRLDPGSHLGAEADDMCLSLTLHHNQPATR
jgi:hypothetical protein